jgi:integrase
MYLDLGVDLHLFVEFLKEKKNLQQSSMRIYTDVVENFLMSYNDIYNLESYNDYIIKHAIKKRSNVAYSALKTYIQYKIQDKSLQFTLIEGMIKPPIHQTAKIERKYLTEEQIIGMINNIKDEKHRTIALIQDLSGIRAGDVLRIKRGDIHPEVYEDKAVLKIITDGKGDKRNIVYIHDEIIQMLIINYIVNHFVSNEYYFMENKSRNINADFKDYTNYRSNYIAYYRDLKQAMYKSGISHKDFATHDYRRCYARRVWTRYKDLHVLQELLNHANPATTMRYLKQSGMQNIDYHKEMQSK